MLAVHPRTSAREKPNTMAKSPRVTVNEPKRSSWRRWPTGYFLTNANVPASAAIVMSTLTYITQRQTSSCVRTPPTSKPAVLAAPITAPKMPNACRSAVDPRKLLTTNDIAAGASRAPNTPWAIRDATSSPKFVAEPPTNDAMAKPLNPMIIALRNPTMSATRPPSSNRPPRVSTYAVISHCRSLLVNRSAACVAGSAAATTLLLTTSSISIRQATESAYQRPRSARGGDGTVGGRRSIVWPICPAHGIAR
ncbi:Uncharacterised protein [Mycobacteroides abscessus]|nr:Uncharacterised protein [Mycobacteroides abscessus]